MSDSGGIRKSPYETGLYFVPPEPGTTLQDHASQWSVGARYTLIKVLGYGSYSAVVLALDNTTGERVALKRVADVLQSPDHCKRVLREICILRRLRHPNLIGIRDAFVRPSATGQCRLIGGRLVNMSVDVYIAMELADGGDLFHLRGQMSGDEVKSLMWQLLVTMRYLHSVHVWHRDMKSQNVFLVRENAERVIKIGDFGSARSARPQGYQSAPQAAPLAGALDLRPSCARMHVADSYDQMDKAMEPGDLYAQPERDAGRPSGFKGPLTRVVATPCYRAPEVVMSRGGYTAAIDMWSIGCIFGELLQRIAHVGSAATPALQVAPLFAIHGLPKTPEAGESFAGGPGSELTRSELQALFAVIGTPCWADVAAVQEPQWRRYLHHLPGRAPTLYRRQARFAAAGEAAVDLLSRLLAFDPTRRCSPDEALAHQYFSDLSPSEGGSYDDLTSSPRAMPHSLRSAGAMAVQGGDGGGSEPGGSEGPGELAGRAPMQLEEMEAATAHLDTAHVPASHLGTPLSELRPYVPRQGAAADGSRASCLAAPFADRLRVASDGSDGGGGAEEPGQTRTSPFYSTAADTAGAAAPMDASAAGSQQAAAAAGGGQQRPWYWEEEDPGKALAMLEDELREVAATCSTASPEDEGCQKMRRMLEAECEAIRASLAAPPGGGGGEPGSAGACGGSGKKRARVPHMGGGDTSILSGLLKHRGSGLLVDAAAGGAGDADQYGLGRLPNVADKNAGRELDPSRILGAQRHGEWFQQQGPQGPAPGPAWGVSSLPPGMDASQLDPAMLAVMRAQQGR